MGDSENDASLFSIRKKMDKLLFNDASVALVPEADEERYNMTHDCRGEVIIFNHLNFDMALCPKRDGTNKDRDDLKATFEKLQFNVTAYDDLRTEEIDRILYEASKRDHTNSDCIVVIVLSHGDDSIIYAKDYHYSTSLLWKNFDGNNCPTLAGKPKLFFIQACRGIGKDAGTKVKNVQDISTKETTYTIPVMADILVMYSTVEGFVSWRSLENGSYFIQALVQQLNNYNNKKDLLSTLTIVNRNVALNQAKSKSGTYKQMCSIVSMLTREVYF